MTENIKWSLSFWLKKSYSRREISLIQNSNFNSQNMTDYRKEF